MLTALILSGIAMAICVVIHATGLTGLYRRVGRSLALVDSRFWGGSWLLMRIAALLILLHLAEIAVWALLYAWGEAMPDLASAFYFSSVTYTTVGYGDLVLPKAWRLVGGVEALTGILMCGWSTGFFFSVLARMHHLHEGEGGAPR